MSLRITKVLELLASSREPLALAELRRETQIPPATLNRLLLKLTEDNYVRKAGHGTYEAGAGLISLSMLVMENARALPFRTLLREMAARTGQNAELYTYTTSGPIFLMGAPGKTEFRVNTAPGHVVHRVYTHPAGLFFFRRYPEAFAWRKAQMKAMKVDIEAFKKTVKKAAAERFFIERGQTRPELARACVPADDFNYGVCVSGFTSDFPEENDARLRRLMRQTLNHFQKIKPEKEKS